jgi:hypothetical protein
MRGDASYCGMGRPDFDATRGFTSYWGRPLEGLLTLYIDHKEIYYTTS